MRVCFGHTNIKNYKSVSKYPKRIDLMKMIVDIVTVVLKNIYRFISNTLIKQIQFMLFKNQRQKKSNHIFG